MSVKKAITPGMGRFPVSGEWPGSSYQQPGSMEDTVNSDSPEWGWGENHRNLYEPENSQIDKTWSDEPRKGK